MLTEAVNFQYQQIFKDFYEFLSTFSLEASNSKNYNSNNEKENEILDTKTK